jgi:hypothetical protein
VERCYDEMMRFVDLLSPQNWMLVLGVVIVVGVFCLRGFGSRSKY